MAYSLSWYLMRDGTFYFIIMLVLNVVDIPFFAHADVQLFLSTTIYPLSVLLLSRLLLNLRDAAYTSTTSKTSSGFVDVPSLCTPSSVVFARESTGADPESPDIFESPRLDFADDADDAVLDLFENRS
ncbi:uncharacterized protein B0H18DRAFT_1121145 [Fomitopsis serialis]|uniref:uncharacterized protein n=1 Tax=Fomitopsis serialis TaxID=139415 RepID=UPI0020084A86|nr:uncharacterized protein B0H18DRAFT_1121145 [Neoantrodia serialis]KAH9921840.1 hypothetical protein B0H18DRAFT_1121145 [Neoantrodia serialis]